MNVMKNLVKALRGKCTCSCPGCNNGQHCGISRDGCEK